MHRLCLILIVCLELLNEHGQVLSSNIAIASGEGHSFSLLYPDTVFSTTYSLSTSGWTGVSSTENCALRTISKCPLSRGFLYEPAAGQCTPVLWLGQGSGGTVVPAGAVDAQTVHLYINRKISQFCQDGFEAVEYGSEGRFACIVLLATPLSYNSATSECNSLGGYLVSVRTAEKLQMVTAFDQGSSIWVGIDDQAKEGQYRWQEDGELLTNAEQTAAFYPGEPNNHENMEDCVLYRSSDDLLNDSYCWFSRKALCESQPMSVVC
ncbi:C-type lectin-related protein 4 [Plakobranchus ocellatus]|uniref:C-type lectin-related protein 4 n=1 Tax=Plakobranchus ocellatus TaxID=259542 RepID=A0AAV4CNK5_9GAST|nr:C-type lectin-related protein 4 [Plakobranchus ocellatus]